MFMDVLHVIALCRHSVSALMGCFERLHKLRSVRGLLYMSVSSSSHRSFCCLLKFMAEMYGVQRQVCILESCHARSKLVLVVQLTYIFSSVNATDVLTDLGYNLFEPRPSLAINPFTAPARTFPA